MAKGNAVRITLACTECKQRNYDVYKNKKIRPIELNLANIARSAKSTLLIKKPNNL